MFKIEDYPEVLEHLRKISSLFHMTGKEIVIFCPYCGDSHRKPNPTHGHLYISRFQPVFHCFRCGVSGHLNRLLADTESQIRVDHTLRQFKVPALSSDPKEKCLAYTADFAERHPQEFRRFLTYLSARTGSRLGRVDFSPFLLFPELTEGVLWITFCNFEGRAVLSRAINQSFRYRKRSSGFYFFQEPSFDLFPDIVVAEGPFDIINLYLYNCLFAQAFFVAAGGRHYLSAVEYFLPDMLFGKHVVHLIFDRDVEPKSHIARVKRAVEINSQIKVVGYKSIKHDPGELPDVIQIT